MKIIGFIEEPAITKQILQHLDLWEACLRATHRQVRNNGPPAPLLNIVREPTYQPARDHAPAGDDIWSQVPDYGCWAD